MHKTIESLDAQQKAQTSTVKIILIVGPQSSGKSTEAKKLSEKYKRPIFLDRASVDLGKSRFCFSQCTEETDLIIIDDLKSDFDYKIVYEMLDGIVVDKKCKHPFKISPDVILISQELPLIALSDSFKRRIQIINK